MNLVVLRMEGDQKLLDALVQRLALKPEQAWKAGDHRRNGSAHLSSGFSATVADASNGSELISQLRQFVARCKKLDVSFSGVRAELSVGVTVGDSKQFVAHLALSNADLAMLAERGLTFSVSAYPTSDEANKRRRAI